MAISIIGTPQAAGIQNGGNVTLTFDVSPAQNDYVLVFGGYAVDASLDFTPAPGPSTAGYTTIQQDTTGTGPAIYVGYKKMGASPDANVVCLGSLDTGTGTAYGCVVLRGADLTNFQDQTAVVKVVTAGVPDCSAITTQTADAWVIAMALEQIGLADATRGTVTGYTAVSAATGGDTLDAGVAAVRKTIASPASDDPGAWSSWTTTTYRAVTVAIREEKVLTSTAAVATFTAPASVLLAETTLTATASVVTFSAPVAVADNPGAGTTLTAGASVVTFSAPASVVLAETSLIVTAPTTTLSAPAATRLAETSLVATAAALLFTAPTTTLIFDRFLDALAALVTFTAPTAAVSAGGGGTAPHDLWFDGGIQTITCIHGAQTLERYIRGPLGQIYIKQDDALNTWRQVGTEKLPVGVEPPTDWEIF